MVMDHRMDMPHRKTDTDNKLRNMEGMATVAIHPNKAQVNLKDMVLQLKVNNSKGMVNMVDMEDTAMLAAMAVMNQLPIQDMVDMVMRTIQLPHTVAMEDTEMHFRLMVDMLNLVMEVIIKVQMDMATRSTMHPPMGNNHHSNNMEVTDKEMHMEHLLLLVHEVVADHLDRWDMVQVHLEEAAVVEEVEVAIKAYMVGTRLFTVAFKNLMYK